MVALKKANSSARRRIEKHLFRSKAALSAGVIVTLIALHSVANGPAAMASVAVQTFWDSCSTKIETPPQDGFYRVRHFGRNAEISDLLTELIRNGEKTGTFTSPWLFEGDRNQTPAVGGYTIVTDFLGAPKLLLRTTIMETKPFNDITEEDTQIEGPSVRQLAIWRSVHWAYFERILAPLGKVPSMDIPVTIEGFELVCQAEGGFNSR